MTENVNDISLDKRDVKDQLGEADLKGLIVSRWKTEQINFYNIRIRVTKKALGTDNFIAGHSVRGIAGTAKAGIGSMETEWTELSETSGPEIITDDGKNTITNWIRGDTVASFEWIAYGSGTTIFNKLQTALTTEIRRVQTFQGGLQDES